MIGRVNAPFACLWLAAAPCEPLLTSEATATEGYACLWIQARQGQADAVARRLEGHLDDPRARFLLARIESDRGRDAAERLYGEAAREFASRGDAPGEALARLGLAAFHVRRGRFADAGNAIAEADALTRRSGDRVLAARVRNQRGWLAHQKGEFAEAWRLFKEVEAEMIPGGPLDLQALCLSGLGAVAHDTHQLPASMAYTARQAEVSHRLGDSFDEARARGNLVITALRLANADQMEDAEIEPLAREALAAATAAGNRGSEARAHIYLGDLTSGLEAREHYRRAVELGRQVESLTSTVLGLRGLALSLVESEPRDAPRAFRLVDEAEALARPSPPYFAVARAERARLRMITGPRDRAVADALSALEAVEAIRDRQADGLARARVFSASTFLYYRLAGFLLSAPERSPADLELAFAVGERMRARVLLDELDAAGATAVLAAAGEAHSGRAEVLKALAAVQRRLLDPALERAERERGLRELERLEREESALRTEIGSTLRAPRLYSLQELRGLLAEDEALLSFVVASRRNPDHRPTRDGSWVWVITREGVRIHPIPDREALRPLVSLFLGLIERRDEARSSPRLYRELLAQAVSGLPPRVGRLIVVADGPLHRLPLGALRATADAEPLASRYVISQAPSAALWARWRAAPAVLAPAALVLADPPQHLGPLPHARREARAIGRRLGARASVHAGAAAAEPILKDGGLSRFDVLHFAAHAVVDEEHPERSAVLLAPGGAVEDGLLQAREIVGLDLRGDLVFLSACRSGGGALVDGEGPLSLARAFFQAGARTVVGSLWPLRDDEAVDVVDAFYRHLSGGGSAAEALASAQRERIRAGAPAAAWAGLVALGDGDVRLASAGPVTEAGPGAIVLRIAMGLAIAGVAIFFVWRRWR
jgi:CHAT domain-containing protein